MALVQLPRPFLVDANGNPRIGAKAYFYQAGTTTAITTYTTRAYAVAHAHPVESVATGAAYGLFPAIYVNPAVNATYKVVVTDATGTVLYTEDEIQASEVTAALIGAALYPTTDEETAASVTPTDKTFPPGNIRRYGAVSGGVTDCTTAIQAALDQHNQGGAKAYVPAGTWLTGTINWPGNNLTLHGESSAFSYNTSASPKSILRAKTATTVMLDLVQTGLAEDRTGNLISDLEIDGNGIATIGIDCAGSNTIERCRVRRCSTAGVHLNNFTNGTRIVRCGLNSNTGWGLQAEGVSTTTYSVTDTNTSLNTLGGMDLQAGVLVHCKSVISESNDGPGLRIYRPSSHTNSISSFVFDSCWFEDNGETTPFYTIVIDAQSRSLANAPESITFRHCRINPSASTRKHMQIGCANRVTFDHCQFDASTATDALTLTSTAYYVAWLDSAVAQGFTGLSETQLDNAIAQGTYCWSYDRGIAREVGSGSPAAAFANSWVNYGSGFKAAQYSFDREGNVVIEGSIKTGSSGTVAFTLPVGYRPAAQYAFAVDANGSHGLVYVETDGDVNINTGSSTVTHLNGIKFQREIA